ncbi:hypothetical protein AB5I39_11985 [Sphingomonas sp. MMS24-J45]|uniref:hypothetical protein n=1 Tax=Sphingomonas sp. MMS24-J45 TaxID=3238806 RepID=UPI00384E20BD
MSARTVHLIVPLSLAMQVIGAGAAIVLAGRVPPRMTVACVGALNLGVLAAMAAAPPGLFVVASALFGFLWLFAMPFQVPLVIAADPTRRSALLIGGAQLVGSSLGPLFASGLVSGSDVTPVLLFGAFCLILAVLALVVAELLRHSVGDDDRPCLETLTTQAGTRPGDV